MIRHVALLAIAAAALLTGLPAHAQTSRLYLAGYLGLNTFNDQEFSESSVPVNGDLSIENDISFAGALGLRLSNNVRAEAELSYSNNDFGTMHLNGAGTFNADGDLSTWLGLVNVYYDFNVPWKIQPFIGVGAGLGWFDGTINDASGMAASASDDAMAFAWQAGGGLKYRFNPDLALTGGYRYIGATDLSIGSYEVDYGSHEFRVGVEYDLPVAGK